MTKRHDPSANYRFVLVPYQVLDDGSLGDMIPQPDQADGTPVFGIMSTRRGPDDAYSTGSVGFGLNGRLILDGAAHMFSGNAIESGSKGLGVARPKGAAAVTGKASAAARYAVQDNDTE